MPPFSKESRFPFRRIAPLLHYIIINHPFVIVTHRAWPDSTSRLSIARIMSARPPTDPRTLFGQRLAQLRKARGWSQETLALESGVARSYLGGVERGQRNISLVNICRLAATLELPPSKLLAFESARPRSKRR